MKHLKIFEDYTNPKGKTVYTKGVDDKILLSKMGKMQKWLKTKGVDTYQKSYDEVQQTYANYLRTNPNEKGVWVKMHQI